MRTEAAAVRTRTAIQSTRNLSASLRIANHHPPARNRVGKRSNGDPERTRRRGPVTGLRRADGFRRRPRSGPVQGSQRACPRGAATLRLCRVRAPEYRGAELAVHFEEPPRRGSPSAIVAAMDMWPDLDPTLFEELEQAIEKGKLPLRETGARSGYRLQPCLQESGRFPSVPSSPLEPHESNPPSLAFRQAGCEKPTGSCPQARRSTTG
jgi:hypothetical protein